MGAPEHIVIATWFYEGQPGYLDFKYRIKALAERYRVTLLLRNAFFEKEFADLPLSTRVFSTQGTSMLEQLRFMRDCARFCRSQPTDLVVLLGSQLAITAYGLKGLPTLLYWNEHPTHFFFPDYRHPLKRLVSRLLLRFNYAAANRVSKVMPIGEAHLEDLLNHGVDARRAELIYMGVEDRFGFLAQVNQAVSLRLVYTGTVMRERGRDVMLEGLALARQRGANATLTIVGAAEDQLAYCRQRAAELGIAEAVQVVGRVPGSEIPRYLADADVGICIWEDRIWWRFNPPTKLFEYLVAGLPVLGSRIRTHSDYVTDGQNGWIFDYDAAAFAAVIASVEAQRTQLPAVSQAAHASGKKYLWSALAPQFLGLVDRTLNEQQGAST
ncbi:glycosyltransferase family 4 protein [Duganella sp. BuS-21]|uniref:glycosyltransferase family 4 protein n=1 Tax=Duganella sp. BuS-21 TaxID=2943848 RepID=UPI0035A740C8